MIKLDYSLQTPEERNQLVNQILSEANPEELTPKYLEILADYLILCMEKQEKKQKKILTENRLTTVNKRETSFEGMISQMEMNEDGIYNLITNSKSIIFQPKISITKKDLEEIPELAQLRSAIEAYELKLKTTEGRAAYIIKKALIEMRKEQYIIKAAFRKPIVANQITRTNFPVELNEEVTINEEGYCEATGISLINPEICSAVLCNYSRLKADSEGEFRSDLWALMHDFDDIVGEALRFYPLYEKIAIYKIDGLQNAEIQRLIQLEFGIKHTPEYISHIWRKKIPGLVASAAEDQYLYWYYTSQEKGNFKICSRCGQIKLAHTKYFSRNKTSKDNFYSICKSCRNKRKK